MLAVVLSYNVLFLFVSWKCLCQTGALDWMVVMAIDSWWLGSVKLSSVSLLPPSIIVCFLSFQIKGIHFFLDFQWL